MRKFALVVAVTCALSGCESTAILEEVLAGASNRSGLDNATIASGLQEALRVGSGRAVSTLGREGGFSRSVFRIPLPEKLQDARQVASRFGLAKPFDDLEIKMNEAAEAAAPQARELFVAAIAQLTFQDVMQIYRGPDDAATQYLRRTTGDRLNREMRGVIDQKLSEVGAVRVFDDLLRRYNALPLVTPIEADLNQHVVNYAGDAVFTRLATEEAAIRADPAKRTTALLRRVFGAG
ncbi:MAG: DUF4197 domain-containing protein [Pseudomonadota bacterium]